MESYSDSGLANIPTSISREFYGKFPKFLQEENGSEP